MIAFSRHKYYKYQKLLKFKENEVNRLTKKFVEEHTDTDIVCEESKAPARRNTATRASAWPAGSRQTPAWASSGNPHRRRR